MDDDFDDSSDEDFNPEKEKTEVVSEEESDGEPEDEINPEENSTSRKRGKTKTKRKSKKIKIDEPENEEPAPPELTQEGQKKKADSLWADFLKDTDTKPKPTPPKIEQEICAEKMPEKKVVTVTKIFEFAGEEVTVTKEVPVSSLDAKIATPKSTMAPSRRSAGGGGGISSILSQLGKKQKISTLEKSKLDWDRFKKDENIEDELQAHNKGKNGYLERQDFLQRADLRQFEIEKQTRAMHRSSRI